MCDILLRQSRLLNCHLRQLWLPGSHTVKSPHKRQGHTQWQMQMETNTNIPSHTHFHMAFFSTLFPSSLWMTALFPPPPGLQLYKTPNCSRKLLFITGRIWIPIELSDNSGEWKGWTCSKLNIINLMFFMSLLCHQRNLNYSVWSFLRHFFSFHFSSFFSAFSPILAVFSKEVVVM